MINTSLQKKIFYIPRQKYIPNISFTSGIHALSLVNTTVFSCLKSLFTTENSIISEIITSVESFAKNQLYLGILQTIFHGIQLYSWIQDRIEITSQKQSIQSFFVPQFISNDNKVYLFSKIQSGYELTFDDVQIFSGLAVSLIKIACAFTDINESSNTSASLNRVHDYMNGIFTAILSANFLGFGSHQSYYEITYIEEDQQILDIINLGDILEPQEIVEDNLI